MGDLPHPTRIPLIPPRHGEGDHCEAMVEGIANTNLTFPNPLHHISFASLSRAVSLPVPGRNLRRIKGNLHP